MDGGLEQQTELSINKMLPNVKYKSIIIDRNGLKGSIQPTPNWDCWQGKYLDAVRRILLDAIASAPEE